MIFSHAGPVAGFYGQEDLGAQISDEQSLGGVAVAGFFFFSGFLITRSRAPHRDGPLLLAALPADHAGVLVRAAADRVRARRRSPGSRSRARSPATGTPTYDSPFTYVFQNMFLVLDQRNIAGMGTSVPFAEIGGYDWNGSAWTLAVRVQGLHPGRRPRRRRLCRQPLGLDRSPRSAIIAFNSLLWSGHVSPRRPGTTSVARAVRPPVPRPTPFNPMLIAPFAFGMLFALWGDYIPVSDCAGRASASRWRCSPTTRAAGTSAASTASSTS